MLTETWVIFRRQVRHHLRNPVWVSFGVAQPIVYLVLFGPLLANLRGGGLGGDDSLNVFVPGLLVQLSVLGSGLAGFAAIQELREGVIDRQRVTQARRSSLVLGRSLAHVATIVVQSTFLILVAIPLGLRPHVGGAALTVALLALLSLGLASGAFSLGLLLREEMALSPLLQGLTLPAVLLSGFLLPMTLAPGWLWRFSQFNPLSYLVDAGRDLFAGDLASRSVAEGLAVAIAVTLLLTVWSTRRLQRQDR